MTRRSNSNNIGESVGAIIALIIILYIFLALVFPAFCHAGFTNLCGL